MGLHFKWYALYIVLCFPKPHFQMLAYDEQRIEQVRVLGTVVQNLKYSGTHLEIWSYYLTFLHAEPCPGSGSVESYTRLKCFLQFETKGRETQTRRTSAGWHFLLRNQMWSIHLHSSKYDAWTCVKFLDVEIKPEYDWKWPSYGMLRRVIW
jgi:hypothetical protein